MADKQFGSDGFTAEHLPDLTGKTFAITGANSGIGLEAARYLGGRNATVLMLCRNASKAESARNALRQSAPGGKYETISLDLADFSTLSPATDAIRQATDRLDGLILNAGVMMLPRRQITKDGFEMQYQVNVLSHFALAAALADLVETASGRFVWLSSIAHHYAKHPKLTDLGYAAGYSPTSSYAKSKLADLMLGLELHRRLSAAGKSAGSYIAHPGYSDTNLQSAGPGAILGTLIKPFTMIFSQPAEKGALPTVLAAAYPKAQPGVLYGPTGFQEMKGPVGEAAIKPWAKDPQVAKQLWSVCEEATGREWSMA
ncbi:dehydrogenase [Parvularcula bermudensis HTCC2503]|uniref:Dehydrogenase n=1 Tax=Parvularcula bermudensis (strain ATCC BAA-594 / HTCC2503 / KCTC 12087) TaxID=314260 RepID=E0TDR7_PARBH|nr:SDR family NAD(P)-dependent oxidoreductase [Parvularcula bermudensis]ADM09983.1 dehydrogenase [Parvularcula bermudensis HTCC2503]